RHRRYGAFRQRYRQAILCKAGYRVSRLISRSWNLLMASYPDLAHLVHAVDLGSPEADFRQKVIPYLSSIWLDDYCSNCRDPDIIETTVSDFSYLFDLNAERLIAAWGISHGRHTGARDASRMAGHPLSAGPLYHRGHAIPHTLGGPTDINL